MDHKIPGRYSVRGRQYCIDVFGGAASAALSFGSFFVAIECYFRVAVLRNYFDLTAFSLLCDLILLLFKLSLEIVACMVRVQITGQSSFLRSQLKNSSAYQTDLAILSALYLSDRPKGQCSIEGSACYIDLSGCRIELELNITKHTIFVMQAFSP